MSADAPGLLAVWTDIPPALEAEFNAWYDREHLAERLGIPGFRSARRYAAVAAAPKYFALYETESVAVLASPAYRAFLGERMTEASKRIMPRFVNNHRACCTLLARHGRGSGGMVAALRFHTAALDAAGAGAHLREIAAKPGIVRASLWATDADVTGGAPAKPAPEYLVVLDGSDGAALAAAVKAIRKKLKAAEIAASGLYRLLVGLPD
jgi:hypothetical protein